MDQGLGLGTGFPLFNRATASLTRFLQLRAPPPGGKKPPPVLVVHGRGGHAVGDLASYDYFTLGGPYSVRPCDIPPRCGNASLSSCCDCQGKGRENWSSVCGSRPGAAPMRWVTWPLLVDSCWRGLCLECACLLPMHRVCL